MTSVDSSPHPTDSSKITLIGAGPVGSLLSVYLAQRGFQVEIIERRADMRAEQITAGRSINLAVSTRGIHALKQIGLETDILEQAVPMRGRMIHSIKGDLSFQAYGKDDSEFINSISRGGLNKALMTAAEETKRVNIKFNQRAVDVDFKTGVLEVFDEDNEETLELSPQVLIGTDGSASAVRHAMMKLPGHQSKEEFLDYGYKELHIPPGPGSKFLMEKNALHIWPRGSFMLIALPNFEGSYTCTLFLPFEGPTSFEQLTTPERVNAFFCEHFVDAVPLLENLADTFFSNPTGHMSTIKCSPWYAGGNTLLLGDAAHGIVPFFGQGMNCGFEDCTVLSDCMSAQLANGKLDWSLLFKEFYELRKAHTDAIADLALENFVEMRDKVGNPRFLMQKSVEQILQNSFPGKYYSRYSLVTFSRIPYKLALEAGFILDEILLELCADITSAEMVDLKQAEKLIGAKLTPFLKQHDQELVSGLR